MPFELSTEVAVARDLPEEGLRRGDVATIIERVQNTAGDEGYLIEVANALGQTLKVVAVPASVLEPLTADHFLAVRSLASSGTK